MATFDLMRAQSSQNNGKAAQRIERIRATMETDLRTLSAKKGDERDSEIASTLKQAYSRLTAATALASLSNQLVTQPSPISMAGRGATSTCIDDDSHPFGCIGGNRKEEIASNRVAEIDDPSSFRGDTSLTFPQKLMEILDDKKNEGIIAWLPHGESFTICNRRRFTSEVMPKYFGNSKYSSFIRKLNRWGFVQKGIGAQAGAYHHVDFQRGRRNLCAQIRSRAATKFRAGSAPTSPVFSENNLKQKTSFEYVPMFNNGVKYAFPRHGTNGTNCGAALQLHPTFCAPHSGSISMKNLMSVDKLQNCVLSSLRTQQIDQVATSSMSSVRVAESTAPAQQLRNQTVDPGSSSGGLVSTVISKATNSTPKQFKSQRTPNNHVENFPQIFQIGRNHQPSLMAIALEIRSRTASSSRNRAATMPSAYAA